MAKIIYDIFDEKLLSNSSYQYRMSMFLSNLACTYLIMDGDKWLAYKSYALEAHNRDLFSIRDELELLMSTDKMLNLSFKEVRINYLTTAFTLVPEELFCEDDPYVYLNAVCPSPAAEILQIDDVALSSIYNLFLTKIDLKQYISKVYPEAKFSHLFTKLIWNFHFDNERKGEAMYINFHQNQMQIIAYNEKRLLFANNFDFQTISDVAYYTMLVINQLGLNPEGVLLYLSGHINSNAELYNTICRYVRHVNFLETSIDEFPKDSLFAAYPRHTFFDIDSYHIL